MTPRRGRVADERQRVEHLLRDERWNGCRAGEEVAVPEAATRGTRFLFRAHVRNERNGASWVEVLEVVPGHGGDQRVRSFRPDQVFPAGRRGSALSLAEAPRLPLG